MTRFDGIVTRHHRAQPAEGQAFFRTPYRQEILTIGFAPGVACNFAKTGILPVIPC